jgi:hypothetical protein
MDQVSMEGTLVRQQDMSVNKANFLSNVFTIEAQSAREPIATSDTYTLEKIDVKDLKKPFTFVMPLTSAGTKGMIKQCMYLNSANKWAKLECVSSITPSNDKEMHCCSYHMTQFAV